MSETSLTRITKDDRTLLENLWQLYSHDLSKFSRTHIELDGRFKLHRLPLLFAREDRVGYLFYRDSQLAGFAIIRGLDQEFKIVSEFFILGSFQGQKVGRAIALELFSLYPGRWGIHFQETNTLAGKFWRDVAEIASPSKWSEDRLPIADKSQLPYDNWISFVSN